MLWSHHVKVWCRFDCSHIMNSGGFVKVKILVCQTVWVAKSMDEGVAIGASLVSQATATEVGAAGVNRQPWANAPIIPGPLSDYMDAQFVFFNSKKISESTKTEEAPAPACWGRSVMSRCGWAGLNSTPTAIWKPSIPLSVCFRSTKTSKSSLMEAAFRYLPEGEGRA